MKNELKIIAGLDIGNGYVKGKATVNNGDVMLVDMPSVVSYTVGDNIPKIPTDEYMNNLVNELDATVTSRAIKTSDAGRVFFGKRGIRSGESLREFNIENHVPKCKDALSTMLILGSISSIAIESYYKEHKTLPGDNLDVVCALGIALPIEDFMEWKDVYRNTLMTDKHHIIIHNFDHDIDVSVTFKNVEVLAEGAAAQYAIAGLGADFLQLAIDDARSNGAQIDNVYTGEMLANAQNTIGIDIGEGTTNFPVFNNGSVSIESSTSINKGYGTVLTNVVAQLRNTNYAPETRKELADFMLIQNPMPAQKHIQDNMRVYINKQITIFVRDVLKEFSNIFRKVGLRTDVIYIYGGGSKDVKDTLYPAIIEAVTLDDGSCLPVIYLDSSYSRDLNRTGLYEIATLGAEVVGMIGSNKEVK